MRKRQGQTILEYTVIFIIILGCLVAMQNYIKRGIQGRWKSATDGFGEQYDPNSVYSNILYTTNSSSASFISVINGEGQVGSLSGVPIMGDGQWTNRFDNSDTIETKTGYTQVGS